MRKHILMTMTAACMAMALTACGSSGSGSADTTAANAGGDAAAEAPAEAPAASGDSIKLTWSEVNGEDYGATVGAKAFASKIEELSGGQITVELYLNGTLGDEKQSMQASRWNPGHLPRQRFLSFQLRRGQDQLNRTSVLIQGYGSVRGDGRELFRTGASGFR